MRVAETVNWVDAQQAVAEASARVAGLVRSIRRPEAPALGDWSVVELAVHLSLTVDGVFGMAKGGGGILSDIWQLGSLSGALVTGESERDPARLADRIEASVAQFLTFMREAGDDQVRTWIVPAMQLPLSTLTCHVLNELVVHGRDIAAAEGAAWPISRRDTGLVLNGFLFPVLGGLGRALVDQEEAAGVRATYDVRVRGGGRAVFRFDNGDLTVTRGAPAAGTSVDCKLSVEPAAFLLVAWGRIDQWSAIAKGQLFAWGRKPWLGLQLRKLLRNP